MNTSIPKLRHLKQIISNPKIQNKYFTTNQKVNMPLVVPGINSGGEQSKTEEWTNKLVGKKLGEGSDSTVRYPWVLDLPSISLVKETSSSKDIG